MKKKKRINTRLKQMIYLLLPFFCFAVSVFSMQSYALDGDTANSVLNIINNVGNTFNQAKQQEQQQMMAMQAMANANSIFQSSSPLGIPARYFPACPIPAKIDPPANMCAAGSVQDQGQAMVASRMIELAQNHMTYYEKMSSPQDSAAPGGTACLKEGQKALDKKIQEKMNSLDELINQVNKSNPFAKDSFQKDLDALNSLNQTLTGKQSKNLKDKVDTLSDIFKGSTCGEVIGETKIDSSKGLLGVRANMKGSGMKEQANDILSNESKIKALIDKKITDMVADISKYGVSYYPKVQENGKYIGVNKSLNVAAIEEYQKIQSRYQAIANDLSKDFPGWNLYKMDKNFQSNIKKFSSQSADYFKKRSINNCVTKAENNGGLGFSIDIILTKLYQPNASASSTTTRNYKRSLQAILAQDVFIEDKLANIVNLDKSFGKSVLLKVNENFGGVQSHTASSLFSNLIARCRDRYEKNSVFSTGAKNDVRSEKDIVEQANNAIKEMKDLESNFVSTLTKSLREKVENCSDEGFDNNQLNYKDSSDFCLSSAKKAATMVNSCNTKIETKIKEYQTKIVQNQQAFNTKVLAHVVKQEADLKAIQQNVLFDLDYFNKYFPDVRFPSTKDVFIQRPEMKNDEYGVRLMGADLNFIDELPKNLEKMKKMITEARKQITRNLTNYISEQEAEMDKSSTKWQAFKMACSQAIAAFNQLQQENALKAEAQAKEMSEDSNSTASYCKRFKGLSSAHPGPGCERKVEGLVEDYGEIERYITDGDNVTFILNQYEQFCFKLQAEADDTDDKKSLTLSTLCTENGNWGTVKAELASQIPSYARGDKKDKDDEDDEDDGDFLGKSKKDKDKDTYDGPASPKAANYDKILKYAKDIPEYSIESAVKGITDIKSALETDLKKETETLSAAASADIDKKISTLEKEYVEECAKITTLQPTFSCDPNEETRLQSLEEKLEDDSLDVNQKTSITSAIATLGKITILKTEAKNGPELNTKASKLKQKIDYLDSQIAKIKKTTEDDNICSRLERNVIVAVIETCNGKDDDDKASVKGCVDKTLKDKDFDKMDYLSSSYNNLSNQIQRFNAVKDPEKDQADWQGLGEAAQTSCINGFTQNRAAKGYGQNMNQDGSMGTNIFNGVRGY